MSGWNAWTKPYVDAGVYHCGIFDQVGNPWACENLNLSTSEAAKLADVIKKHDERVFGEGISMEGQKWTVIRLDDDTMVMRGKDDANKEKTMTVSLGKTCMVVGSNKDSSHPGQMVSAKVGALKKQMEDAGF